MCESRILNVLLVAPALALLVVLFVYPLVYSLVSAFVDQDGVAGLANFIKAVDFYSTDIVFTVVIVLTSTVLIGIVALAIGGYLTLGENPRASMPGYQLNLVTIPSAWTFGVVAISMNFFAAAIFAALAGMT